VSMCFRTISADLKNKNLLHIQILFHISVFSEKMRMKSQKKINLSADYSIALLGVVVFPTVRLTDSLEDTKFREEAVLCFSLEVDNQS